jgi:hypothetical protein
MEALSLKHWEFEQYRQFYYRQKARDTLNTYQCVGLAFGGSSKDSQEYISDLRERAGYTIATAKSSSSTARPFANIMGIPSADDYLKIKSGYSNVE